MAPMMSRRGVAARVDEYAVHVGELYPAADVTTASPDETPWGAEDYPLVREYVCAAIDNAGSDPRGVAFGRDGPRLLIRYKRCRDRGLAYVAVLADADAEITEPGVESIAPGVAWWPLGRSAVDAAEVDDTGASDTDAGEQRFLSGLGRELARLRADYRAVVWPETRERAPGPAGEAERGAPRTPPGTRVGFELRPPRSVRDSQLPPDSIRWLDGRAAVADMVGSWTDYYGTLAIDEAGAWTWTSAADPEKITRGVLRHEEDGRVGFVAAEEGGWFWGDMALRPARTETRLLLRYPGHAVVKQLVRGDVIDRRRLLITNDEGAAVDVQLYFEPDGRFVHGRFWSLPQSRCRFLACSGTTPVLVETDGGAQLWTRSGEVCLCSARLELAADYATRDGSAGRYASTNCSRVRRSGGLTTRPLSPFEDVGTTQWW